MSITSKAILALFIAGVVGGGVLYSNHAQSQATTNGQSEEQTYAISVPIKLADAQMRKVPGSFMLGLAENISKDIGDGAMEVVDVSFAVSAESAAALAPSLQPRLFVGESVYNVQRVELDNWDPKAERAVDKSKPVGETHFYHFFLPLEEAKEIQDSDATFITTLEKAEIMDRTDGNLTPRSLKAIDGDLYQHVIRLDKDMLFGG